MLLPLCRVDSSFRTTYSLVLRDMKSDIILDKYLALLQTKRGVGVCYN